MYIVDSHIVNYINHKHINLKFVEIFLATHPDSFKKLLLHYCLWVNVEWNKNWYWFDVTFEIFLQILPSWIIFLVHVQCMLFFPLDLQWKHTIYQNEFFMTPTIDLFYFFSFLSSFVVFFTSLLVFPLSCIFNVLLLWRNKHFVSCSLFIVWWILWWTRYVG